MVGASLPLSFLLSGGAPFGDRNALLASIHARGVQSVELRSVKPNTAPDDVLAAAQHVWDAGMQITVHSTASSVETAVNDVFAPLVRLLPALRQDSVVLVIHPVVGDNAAMLRALDAHIEENGYPVRIALENNRLLPDKVSDGDSVALVLEAAIAADCKHVGLCWDMGHYRYFLKKLHPDQLDMLPPRAFLERVIHTHIHATNGLRTHFPLHLYELPLKAYCDALKNAGYNGVFNTELEAKRFEDLHDPTDALMGTIDALISATCD